MVKKRTKRKHLSPQALKRSSATARSPQRQADATVKKTNVSEARDPTVLTEGDATEQSSTPKSDNAVRRIQRFLRDRPTDRDDELAADLEVLIEELSTLTDAHGRIRKPLPRATMAGLRRLAAYVAKGDQDAIIWTLILLLDAVLQFNRLAGANPGSFIWLAQRYSVWPIVLQDTAKSCREARKFMTSIGLGSAEPFPGLNIHSKQSLSFLAWLRRNHQKIGKLPGWPHPDPADVAAVKSYADKYIEEYPDPGRLNRGEYRKDVEDSAGAVFRQIEASKQPRPGGRRRSQKQNADPTT